MNEVPPLFHQARSRLPGTAKDRRFQGLFGRRPAGKAIEVEFGIRVSTPTDLIRRALQVLAAASTLGLGPTAAGPLTTYGAPPVVSNVRVQQRPDSKLVDVTYDVHAAEGYTLRVDLLVSEDGGALFRVPVAQCTGDWGADVAPGTNRHIAWNAGEDWDAHFTTQAVFRVVATDAEARTNAYLVIDLSGGASADEYPTLGWTGTPRQLVSRFPVKTTNLALVRLPGGTFEMGSPTNEPGRYADETRRAVSLTRDVDVGVFEVTREQWYRVMGTGAVTDATRPVEDVDWAVLRGGQWPGGDRAPATNSFIGRLRERTGLDVDLPTEAQWEYACRAGGGGPLNSADALTPWNLSRLGRVSANATPNGAAAPVGACAPNAWGVYDAHGNVAEWCLDRYTPTPASLPSSDPEGAVSGGARVWRGGSRFDIPRDCRAAARHYALSNSPALGRGCRLVVNHQEALLPPAVCSPHTASADSASTTVDTMPGVTVTASHTWGGGDARRVYIKDCGGSAGGGWSLLDVQGDMCVIASASDPFTMQVASLSDDGTNGPAAGFANDQERAWRIVTCSGVLQPFDPSAIRIDTTHFAHDLGEGGFVVSATNDGLDLLFSTNLPAQSQGTLIGVNFSSAGDGVMGEDDVAGVISQSHWNDAAIPDTVGQTATIQAGYVVDDTGAVVPGASVSWEVGESTGVPAGELEGGPPFSTADHRLMENWLTTSSSNEAGGIRVAIRGVPYPHYDLILYCDRRNDINEQQTALAVREGTNFAGTVLGTHVVVDPLQVHFGGVFAESATSGATGNYVVVRALAASNLTVSAYGTAATPRAQLNAIQLRERSPDPETPGAPKAHWALDETTGQVVRDYGPDELHGTRGTTSVGDLEDPEIGQPGTLGYAYAFSETDRDRVTLSQHISRFASDTSGAVSLWFRTASTLRQPLLDFGETTTSDRLLLELPSSRKLRFLIRDNGINTVDLTTSEDYADGNWHHVVVSQTAATNGTEVVFVVDGRVPALGTAVRAGDWFAAINAPNIFTLGFERRTKYTYALEGALDDVAVWDEPMSTGEAIALYNLGHHPELAYNALEASRLFGLHAAQLDVVVVRDRSWTRFSDTLGSPGALQQFGRHFTLWLTETSGVRTTPPGTVLIVR